MSCIKNIFSSLQTKPLKLSFGLILIFSIVAITILLMKVTLPDAFTYCAPDANHILPSILLLLFALTGICTTFIIRIENPEAMKIARVIAVFIILVALFLLSNSRTHFSYNTKSKDWYRESMLGFPLSEINRLDINETKHVNYFGNVLLLDKDGGVCDFGNYVYISPVLYLPDGSRKTLNMVSFPYDHPSELATFNEENGQKRGVIGSDMKVIVPPNTYQYVDLIGNGNRYVYILVENKSYKYGFLNNKGEILIPCDYDLMKTDFHWAAPSKHLLEGGYLYAINGEEIMLVDTLNTVLSYENYQKKFPDVELVEKEEIESWARDLIHNSWGWEPTPEVEEP